MFGNETCPVAIGWLKRQTTWPGFRLPSQSPRISIPAIACPSRGPVHKCSSSTTTTSVPTRPRPSRSSKARALVEGVLLSIGRSAHHYLHQGVLCLSERNIVITSSTWTTHSQSSTDPLALLEVSIPNTHYRPLRISDRYPPRDFYLVAEQALLQDERSFVRWKRLSVSSSSGRASTAPYHLSTVPAHKRSVYFPCRRRCSQCQNVHGIPTRLGTAK